MFSRLWRNSVSPPRIRAELRFVQLELRDVPAQWFAVNIESPTWGDHGSSSLEVTNGGIKASAESEAGWDSLGFEWADSPLQAIKQSLFGTIFVGNQSYSMNPDTLSDDPARRTPFLIVPNDIGFDVRLEDMAALPENCDWDYNDTKWTVSVSSFSDPVPAPAPVDPKTAPVEVDPTTMDRIKSGKVPARVDPTDKTKIEITVSGGHMDGSTPKTIDIDVGGNGTAKRKVKITLTPTQIDPNIDPTKKAHDVKIGGTAADPGPPADAKPDDAAAAPKITQVKPNDGKDKNVRKTQFPTSWTEAMIKDAVQKAAEAAQKGGNGTEWKPDPNNPNKGTFTGTVNGVKITGSWILKDGKLVITHAYPVE